MLMMVIASLESENDKVFLLNLYNDYYGLVRKNVYYIIHDADYVEDLVNDTFIRLIEKVSLIRTLDSPRLVAYVSYTSRSVAINFIKHREVQNKYTFYGRDEDLSENNSDLKDDIEGEIIHQEEIKELGNTVLRLPEKYKDILYFKYILEMTDREIGNVLNIAPDSVRQYLTRARRAAKELMNKEMSQCAK